MTTKKLVFAIPSLGRSGTISKQTIETLENLSVPFGAVHIFVADEDEEALYKKEIPAECKVVVGKLGIGNQRTFINEYFEEGTRIVVLDDDVQIIAKVENKVKVLGEPLIPLVEKAFRLCDELGAKMWSVVNTSNGFFMKHECVYGLRGMYGALYGEYSRDPSTQSPLQHSEDCEKGVKHYLEYGGFVRLCDIGVKQTRYSSGGVTQNLGGKENRILAYKEVSDYLVKKYPDLVKPKKNPDPSKGLVRISPKTVSRHSSLLSNI